MANSTKPLGRIDFVLRFLGATLAAIAAQRFVSAKDSPYLDFLPYYLRDSVPFIAFYVPMIFGSKTLAARAVDAGLPRKYSLWVGLIWVFAVAFLSYPHRIFSFGLAWLAPCVLLILLSVGGLMPSRPVPVEVVFEDLAQALPMRSRPRFSVDATGYFVHMLVYAGLWMTLIWLEDTSGDGIGAWIARLGYLIGVGLWLFSTSGRFEDAGLSSDWYPGLYCMLVAASTMLPLGFKLISGYGAVVVFVLVQLPILLLKSKPRPANSLPEIADAIAEAGEPISSEDDIPSVAPTARPPVGGINSSSFMIFSGVVSCIWLALIFLDATSNYGPDVWIARTGYVLLSLLWFGASLSRLTNTDVSNPYTRYFYLIVPTVALTPLLLGFINGYEALLIFVIIQIPTVFLRTKQDPITRLRHSDAPESGTNAHY